MTDLGQYLNEIRKRHPRLSMRRMAIDAGLGESIVNGIINRGMGARPETLKALTDRWGTEADYRQLMQLAGHPLPEDTIGDRLTMAQKILIANYSQLSTDHQRTVDWILDKHSIEGADPSVLDVISALRQLNDQDRAKLLRHVLNLAS